MRFLTQLVFVIYLSALGFLAWGAEQIVQNTEQFIHDTQSVINLKFSKRLEYVRLYPGNLCKQCTIMLKLNSTNPADLSEITRDETIKIPAITGSLLQDTKFQGDQQGNVTITMDFSAIVSIAIEQDTNRFNLKITTSPYERPQDAVAEKNATESGTPKQDIPDRIYVINLESSIQPLTLKKLDAYPELKDYKNYLTRIEFKNQKWYRHRLGFAASEVEAADLLVKVQAIFPSAWIDTASPSEVAIARKYYALYPDKLLQAKKTTTAVAKTEQQQATTPATQPPTATAAPEIKWKAGGEVATSAAVPTPQTGTATAGANAAPDTTTATAKKKSGAEVTTLPPEVTGGSDEKARSLMERARQAMIDGNYPIAIGIYTKMLDTGNLQERKDAREYLGLARERNGQIAQAQANYEEYIRDYPNGPDGDRLRQRLVGLSTAKSSPQKELVKTETKKVEAVWDISNSFSQYYRNQNTRLDIPPATPNAQGTTQAFTADKSLSTDFSSNGRYRGERYDMRYQINANDYYSFLNTSTSKYDFRLNSAYLDTSDRLTNMTYRVGRQTQSSYGILGRFDGLFYSYRFDPKYKVNFIYGNPVDFQVTKKINHAKKVTGLSLDMGTFAEHWDMNVYAVQQTADNILDRKAVGTEMKYLSQDFTAFSILDYDVNFKQLNTALFFSSWRFKDNTSVNLNLDYRKSPMVMMTSGLSGVTGATTLSQLLQLYPESTVRQLVADRTSQQRNLSASINMPLSTNYQLGADFSYSYTGKTADSTYVNPVISGTPSTGNQYSYGAQLIGNNVIFNNDIANYGLRYTDAPHNASWTMNFSDRISVNSDWRLNPKFTLNHQNATDGSSRIIYKPSFKVEYKADKNMRLDGEIGIERGITKGGTNDGAVENNHYIYFGYVYDF
ncbi:MAG: hypothetical protein HY080_17070 [Gammaproteobacteria bacterium]|nr:hypothetical protein [Gammaproteobacteria bacterium]